jgi:hypothetical protein
LQGKAALRFRKGARGNRRQKDREPETRKVYTEAFAASTAPYYGAKPTFDEILAKIASWVDRL